MPLPAHLAAGGDSITQGYNANCTNILCALSGDLPQYSWFNGTSVVSVHTHYQELDPTITAVRESVSGAEMRGGSNSFAAQAARIVARVPQPDHVEVLLGGNDICNRGCIDPRTARRRSTPTSNGATPCGPGSISSSPGCRSAPPCTW